MGERRGTKGLELWCRKMTEGYPGVKIDNMTTSWRDGLAFCAIIHHFRPDLIDFTKLNKDDVYHNNELAFRVAEQYLGIPALLEPEDMVEYSVPDRLSILTYLSQFYQAFAVPHGSNSARIAVKRAQTSPDHGIVSPASTSPPSKVAFSGAGKVRREPCAKCGLPVFIAERLNVGKDLYHRTCFRCARCSSQLTLANYYETENGDFCCEICPDEEKIVTKTPPEKSVLLRSMSDEEKTASLKTFSNEPDNYSAMFETALESIGDESIKQEFTLTRDESSEFFKARSQFIHSQMEESSDTGNEDKPPDLPKSIPPELDKSELRSSENITVLRDTLVASSEHSDSGFPSNRLDTTVNLNNNSVSNQYGKASVELEKTHNIVTKDKRATEGDTSLVKARMRLFENNSTDVNEFRKSDVNKNSQNTFKVPLKSSKSFTYDSKNVTKSPIPIVKLEDLENFEQLSKKEFQDDVTTNIEDNKHTSEASVTLSHKDNFKHSYDNISNKFVQELDDNVNVSLPSNKEEEKEQIMEEAKQINKEPSLISVKEKEPQDCSKDESTEAINTECLLKLESENRYDVTKENLSLDQLTPDEKSIVSPKVEEAEPNSESQSIDITPNKKYENNNKSIITDDKHQDDAEHEKPTHKEQAEYPEDLNPFGDENDETHIVKQKQASTPLNPFEDDDDDYVEDMEKPVSKPVPSPRLRKRIIPTDADKKITGTSDRFSNIHGDQVSINPFESDDDEYNKPPVPATRKKKVITPPKINLNPFESEDEENEEDNFKQPIPKPRTSVGRTTLDVPEPKLRELGNLSLNSNFGSNSSISSGSAYGSVRKKKPAPKPPIPVKTEYFESTTNSLTSSPSHSVQHSPKSTPKYRKTKKAPPPPPSSSTPLPIRKDPENIDLSSSAVSPIKIVGIESDLQDSEHDIPYITEQDVEQEKIVKDEMNRNRQSHNASMQSPTSSENSSSLSAPNKSTFGKWKRRKGQAPNRPIPQRRTIKCLPMSEIRRELEVIEIQQQGLEKQGVRLEQIIREKCEGSGINPDSTADDDSLPIDVEDLILQLFELVNEKNELFRKQAELMYLRRQQRLEEEHADVEYQIRCLMLQPEANKTDSDKAREEELINRLVEIVERRNEIIECLEMDRVREAEEDDSINNHINLYTLKRDGEKLEPEKLRKEKEKDKKKHKKEKKLKHKDKGHKIDADKDIDESEPCSTLEKKKKKKFNIF
ncbi:MICAL-like protein 1 [Anoplophora glabripennis]|uniref:MICAL-like protein 1 n=1 Tax=Anoplophora glabripennis TaxID=217634 RepID=UPI0008748C73|nr:MICAL-like protein 1 [Anoplophora glabripennis]